MQMATRSIGASVPIEQIEAYENYPVDTLYAPTNFYGSLTVTESYGDGGQFYGITFNADPALNNAGVHFRGMPTQSAILSTGPASRPPIHTSQKFTIPRPINS